MALGLNECKQISRQSQGPACPASVREMKRRRCDGSCDGLYLAAKALTRADPPLIGWFRQRGARLGQRRSPADVKIPDTLSTTSSLGRHHRGDRRVSFVVPEARFSELVALHEPAIRHELLRRPA